ncbi:hypothetical protein QWY28_05100 [Nocardioides sp. SOB77]|uniref:Fibronectin type III domain-containing protein n=1 Tax=Nocardioides oceani TaxID=3058369 RepID=A0ABT8FC90_9ACTN|nr:hypothetical protein [Nocardioides oceani]MDN4172309.1 hypothetical protein [Nocardioides oceani]
MPTPRRLRGLVALPAAALLASLVTLAGPAAAPALAEPGCLSEAPSNQTRCDDTVPPETVLGGVAPAPQTDQAWVSSDRVQLTFGGRHTDGDTDPIAFECQFYPTRTAPAAWTACSSPATYAVPDETGPDLVPYTFRVRAVDAADHGLDATSLSGFDCLPIVCQRPTADLEDSDQSPASVQVRVDRTAPSGSARVNGLADEENPEWPMITSRTLQVVLGASGSQDRSPVGFSCTLNQAPVPCAAGTTDLRNLPPGDQRFEAVARDAAGNVDPSPAVVKFSVPRNLTARKNSGWKVVRQGGYFGEDFLQTTKVGALVSAPGTNVRELRLIAPRGPKLGKVEVKIGQSIWRTVNLKGATYERFHVYQVRDQFDPLVSGTIQVRAKKIGRGESVRIDAVLAH